MRRLKNQKENQVGEGTKERKKSKDCIQ